MDQIDLLLRAAAIGIGATVVMDLWALVLRSALGVPSLDYRLVGRWIGHFARGRLSHASIARSEPVRGEALVGWTAHYAIGVAFAAVLLAAAGPEWARRPTLGPALLVGIATVLMPWLVMQPAFGMGVAASRAPNPTAARARSLMTHAVFGIGLYLAARAAALAGL